MTRFAPAWGLYTLCLVLGIGLIYTNGGAAKNVHFAANLAELIQYMGLINLFYAPLVAQLLFGDLYSSRMCNALHAMPLRRETWFFTNLFSGLVFSLIPTLVMTLMSLPLMAGTVYHNGGLIPIYLFLGANLEYLCFFGIAVFCALCVGNRLGMAVLYGLFNFGSYIAYWLIDTIYTPLLYGVVTPSALAENLMPVDHMLSNPFLEIDQYYMLRELFQDNWEAAVGNYSLTENWYTLLIWAGAGLVFALIGLILYRKRDLECAGDAMAFPILEPVFQILCAVVTAAAAQFFLMTFLGVYGSIRYVFLATGLVIGWFGSRMLVERSTRVFRGKNWIGLAALTAVIAVSLFCTHIDLFGVARWVPDADKVASVRMVNMYHDLVEPQEIEDMLRVQEQAIQDRLEHSGPYVMGTNGELVQYIDNNKELTPDDPRELADCVYAVNVRLVYTMKNGREVGRNYVVWADSEAGKITENYLSRWETINGRYNRIDEQEGWESRINVVLSTLEAIYIDGTGEVKDPAVLADAEGLVAAIRADCAEGNMAQEYFYHSGCFLNREMEELGDPLPKTPEMWLSLHGKDRSWSISVFADSRHTLAWLQDHDLITYEILEENYYYY